MAKKNRSLNDINIDDSLKRFEELNDLSSESIYGMDSELPHTNDEEIRKVRNIINKASKMYKDITGNNMIEFYSAINNEKLHDRKTKIKNTLDFNKMLENPEGFNFDSLLMSESDRFSLYNDYRLIYLNIPELSQGLDTYVDNIMSPDDFTKTTFNIILDGENINNIANVDNTEDLDTKKKILDIIEEYGIEKKTKKILTEALKIGDQFVCVLDIKNEVEKILNEDNHLFFNDEAKSLNESFNLKSIDEVDLTDEEFIYLEEALNNEKIEKPILQEGVDPLQNESYKEFKSSKEKMKKFIMETINNNFIIDTKESLLEDNILYKTHFSNRDGQEKDIEMLNLIRNGKGIKNKSKGKVKINGSVVKILNPERVIKLTMDDMEYGYYYFHDDEMNSVGQGDAPVTGNRIFGAVNPNNLTSEIDVNTKTGTMEKRAFITNVFVKNIANKIDKKFINKHGEFKHIIHNLLQKNYILDKQVRITYFSPNEIIHFGDGEGEYYDSIYKKILFMAKLYLAVLMSNLMMKLVRSPEKRAFYIQTDLDNEAESAVQSFVRDIKTKEIGMDNLKSINTIMNSVGAFHDYYIPIFDGERPIEIDTLQGMNVDLEDDLLEYLRNAMISGLGIPPEFLGQLNQAEFARSLAMQNSKFVRNIIVKQKVFSEQFTRLIRAIYRNEYEDEENIAEKINVYFPSPSSLNMTNLIEQMGNSQQLVEFITETIMENNYEDNMEEAKIMKSLVTKEILPMFDWEKYEDLYEQAKKKYTINTLDKNDVPDADGDDTGGTDDYGGF